MNNCENHFVLMISKTSANVCKLFGWGTPPVEERGCQLHLMCYSQRMMPWQSIILCSFMFHVFFLVVHQSVKQNTLRNTIVKAVAEAVPVTRATLPTVSFTGSRLLVGPYICTMSLFWNQVWNIRAPMPHSLLVYTMSLKLHLVSN